MYTVHTCVVYHCWIPHALYMYHDVVYEDVYKPQQCIQGQTGICTWYMRVLGFRVWGLGFMYKGFRV